MKSEWILTRLGDLISLKGGLSYKGTFIGKGDSILVGMGSVSHSDKFIESGIKKYGGEFREQHRLLPGDIVIATRQQSDNLPILGFPAMVPSSFEGKDVIVATNLWKVFNQSEVDNRFLFWLLRSDEYRRHIVSCSKGTTVRMITKDAVENFHFYCPPLQQRISITEQLDQIDNKIQLNHQINQTLEQMAQAIFKSWFVDFEPVKAKIAALEADGSEDDALLAAMQAIAGSALFATDAADADAQTQLARLQADHPEQYATLRATAELFPSAMQESELGEIPEGWECMPLDEVAHYQNGLALQKFRPENEDDFLPVLKIAQLRAGYADGNEKASPNIRKDCIVNNGDVVFSWSGSLIVDVWCGGKAALNQHLFKVTSEEYPKWLYYYFTCHHLEEFQRIAAAKAVTMGHIKREHLRQALCAIPANELIKEASKILGNILDKEIALKLQIKSLSELRDTLLPKLLSGELSISAAIDQITQAEEAIDV